MEVTLPGVVEGLRFVIIIMLNALRYHHADITEMFLL